MTETQFQFPVPRSLLPKLTPDNRPYWEAAARRELAVPRCEDCGTNFLPLSPRCPNCLSSKIGFQAAALEATVASWVRYRKTYYPWTNGVTPYVVALLDVMPGVRLPMLVNPHPDRDPRIGETVRIDFMTVEDFTLPVCSLP